MNVAFFAPSYKRSDRLSTTVRHFPFVRLVIAESELPAYRQRHDPANLLPCPDTAQGNVCRVRNWILDTFLPHYDAVILLDDDLTRVGRYVRGQRLAFSADQLEEFGERAAQLALDAGAFLFGLNANDDKGAYREYTPFSFVSFLGCPFHGHRPNPLRYDESLPLKEDYDMTLQHLLAYRRVRRVNYMHYVCDQSHSTGGCATQRNLRREREQFDRLQTKWGSDIIRYDEQSMRAFDYNPILKSPIPGV